MDDTRFPEHDVKKLKEARKLLMDVLNYHYAVPATKRMWQRLATIAIKLNELIELNENKER